MRQAGPLGKGKGNASESKGFPDYDDADVVFTLEPFASFRLAGPLPRLLSLHSTAVNKAKKRGSHAGRWAGRPPSGRTGTKGRVADTRMGVHEPSQSVGLKQRALLGALEKKEMVGQAARQAGRPTNRPALTARRQRTWRHGPCVRPFVRSFVRLSSSVYLLVTSELAHVTAAAGGGGGCRFYNGAAR